MFNYLKNSINDKSFNTYSVYLANDIISNAEGVEYLDIKFSPVVIQKIKSKLGTYPAKHYTEYKFIDKNTVLKIIDGNRSYYRLHTLDTFIDETIDKNIKFLVAKTHILDTDPTKFPSKSEYHEITSNTSEYSISDTISIYIRNDSRVYIEIKKDDYIDTTIDTLEHIIRKLIDSVDN